MRSTPGIFAMKHFTSACCFSGNGALEQTVIDRKLRHQNKEKSRFFQKLVISRPKMGKSVSVKMLLDQD
jgi:hypothetical protein